MHFAAATRPRHANDSRRGPHPPGARSHSYQSDISFPAAINQEYCRRLHTCELFSSIKKNIKTRHDISGSCAVGGHAPPPRDSLFAPLYTPYVTLRLRKHARWLNTDNDPPAVTAHSTGGHEGGSGLGLDEAVCGALSKTPRGGDLAVAWPCWRRAEAAFGGCPALCLYCR